MKLLLTLPIRVYWRLWPESKRRTCLYRESCSRHVHRVTQQHGLWAGLKALRHRVRTCRPGYQIQTCDGEIVLKLVDGSLLAATDAAERIAGPIDTLLTDARHG